MRNLLACNIPSFEALVDITSIVKKVVEKRSSGALDPIKLIRVEEMLWVRIEHYLPL